MNEEQPGEDQTGWRARVDKWSTWRAEMTEEAARLPQTLAELREAIADLRRIAARLDGATEGLEMLLRRAESSGVAPLARQLDAAATEVEAQLREFREQMPGGQLVNQAVDELQRTIESFSSLLPRPRGATGGRGADEGT